MKRPPLQYTPEHLQNGLHDYLQSITAQAAGRSQMDRRNYISLSNDQAITLTDSYQTIELRRLHHKGDLYTFTGKENFVQVDFEGLIQIHAQLSIDDTSGTSGGAAKGRITKNDSEITGSIFLTDHQGNSEDGKTASATLIETVNKRDTIRLQVKRNSGSDTLKTIADGCRLMMGRIL